MGFFDVPTVERKPWGILALVFNILVPGVGSIIAGAVSGVRKTIIVGIVQFLLFWTIIVYVWSVIDGVRIFKASATHLTEVPTPVAEPEPTPVSAPAAKAAAPKKAAAKKAAPKKAAAKSAKKASKK
ncbi:MAG: hypothetical protein QOC71_1485 [Thermoplasmata archaeon]|jgi:predicted lipid-binding transport protein (Tim44 family)|nr:hypothetical protein [Thermoplasmata archaeon]